MNLNPVGWPNQTSLRQPLPVVGWNAPASYTGNLLDLRVSGTGSFSVSPGVVSLATSFYNASATEGYFFSNGGARHGIGTRYASASNGITLWALGQAHAAAANNGFYVAYQLGFSGTVGGASSQNADTYIAREAVNTLAQLNGTSAQTLRVYNTYTSSTSYERAKLEWSSNVLNIGTEKGSGGGTARSMALQTDATDRLALDTTGSVRVVTPLTVATLPVSPTAGMIARVTNALSPTVGSTVAGGGSANALCWYNGTNWTVLGI